MLSALDRALDDLSGRVDVLDEHSLIDLISGLETAKRRLGAIQALSTARYATLQRADDENAEKAKSSTAVIAKEIALARQDSPHSGTAWLGLADASGRMPETLTALADGRISEFTAREVVSNTNHLSPENQALVDANLAGELRRKGATHRDITGAARALADQIDPAAGVARRKRAEGQRRVTLRPGHDSMCFLTSVQTVERGVTMVNTLRTAAKEFLRDHPQDERSEDQVMADLHFERVTGAQFVTDPIPVFVDLVISESTVFRGGEEPGHIAGGGPVPAQIALELLADAAEHDRAFVRRLYTRPSDGALVQMDSQSRLFPRGLAQFLRRRDQHCATPWCSAPIRHIDHIVPWSQGGRTTLENGQGLCIKCNYTKDLGGFSTTRNPETGVTTFTTRTGHTYDREPPPALGHPVRQDRRREARRKGGRRVDDPEFTLPEGRE